MLVYFSLLGVAVVGLAIVVWLLTQNTSPVSQMEPTASVLDGPGIPINDPLELEKIENSTTQKAPPSTQSNTKKQKKQFGLGNIFRKKKSSEKVIPLTEIGESEVGNTSPLPFLRKLFFKKKKKLTEDDIVPQVTPISNLKKSSTSATGSPTKTTETIPLVKMPAPQKEQPQNTSPLTKQAPSMPTIRSLKQGTEEGNEDTKEEITVVTPPEEDINEKYKHLEKLFDEKNKELIKAQNALNSELKNKKDFNQLKEILEKELQEVKGRSKNHQRELKTALETIENLKKQLLALKPEGGTIAIQETPAQEKPNTIEKQEDKTAQPKNDSISPSKDAIDVSPEEKRIKDLLVPSSMEQHQPQIKGTPTPPKPTDTPNNTSTNENKTEKPEKTENIISNDNSSQKEENDVLSDNEDNEKPPAPPEM